MPKNLVTTLRKRRASPMAQHDRLPPELRAWLTQAALPWSAHSALKLWQRKLRAVGGDASRAQDALSRVEAALIARDAVKVWGKGHPAAQSRFCADNDSAEPQRRNRTSKSAFI